MNSGIIKEMLAGARLCLLEKKQILNDMNVFPIPDGDTGTNMEMTMRGACEAASFLGDTLSAADFDRIYEGILLSSQGNSGVILSQWMKGFLRELSHAQELDALAMYSALLSASQSAYSAVVKPVEGTMLTVARECVEYSEEVLYEDMPLKEYLEAVLCGAEIALDRTPELLPVLKEANVKDSGGYGLVCVLTGFLRALDPDFIADFSQYETSAKVTAKNENEGEFGYCTEMIVALGGKEKFDIKKAIADIEQIGGSVVATLDGGFFKLHVHTLYPEKALEYCHRYGEFIKIKIENMTEQNKALKKNERIPLAIIAVADGDGVTELYKSFGCVTVLRGGQSDNVSTGTLLSAIDAQNADNIILLPNNKNIVMAAKEAEKLRPNVRVVPTKSTAQGYMALMLTNLEDEADRVYNSILTETSLTKTLVIAQAERDSFSNGVEIKKGEYFGAAGDDVLYASADRLKCVLKSLEMLIKGTEDITVLGFTSNSQTLREGETRCSDIAAITGNHEVHFSEGGMSIYDYIFALR